MSITAKNYIVKTTMPNAPRISVNLVTASSEVVEDAIAVYDVEATAYEEKVRETVAIRDYVADRLMKDICVGSGVEGLVSGIDYATNTINLHIKADNVFSNAVAGRSLASVSVISSIEEEVKSLYDTFYVEDSQTVLSTDASCYENKTYDTKAYTIPSTVGGVEADSIFINAIPNAVGTEKVFENKTSGGVNQYVISYAKNYEVSSGVSGAWVLQPAVQSASTIAYIPGAEFTSDSEWTLVPVQGIITISETPVAIVGTVNSAIEPIDLANAVTVTNGETPSFEGTIVSGLTLTSAGIISGTPTEAVDSSYDITVTAVGCPSVTLTVSALIEAESQDNEQEEEQNP